MIELDTFSLKCALDDQFVRQEADSFSFELARPPGGIDWENEKMAIVLFFS
jgi:hypothetical protein